MCAQKSSQDNGTGYRHISDNYTKNFVLGKNEFSSMQNKEFIVRVNKT